MPRQSHNNPIEREKRGCLIATKIIGNLKKKYRKKEALKRRLMYIVSSSLSLKKKSVFSTPTCFTQVRNAAESYLNSFVFVAKP
jgi:hypothetical protein